MPFIEEAILSLFCIPSALVEEQLTEYTWIYFFIQDLKNILDSSLLVHINKTIFLMLLLYSITYWICILVLTVSFLLFFFMKYLGFHLYKSMPFANRDNLTCSFLICMPLISLVLPNCSKTSSTKLNKSGWSQHPCVSQILEESLSASHPWAWY